MHVYNSIKFFCTVHLCIQTCGLHLDSAKWWVFGSIGLAGKMSGLCDSYRPTMPAKNKPTSRPETEGPNTIQHGSEQPN